MRIGKYRICTSNTTNDFNLVNRLKTGLKNSSSIFQNGMEALLKWIEGFRVYQDDIRIYASSKAKLIVARLTKA